MPLMPQVANEDCGYCCWRAEAEEGKSTMNCEMITQKTQSLLESEQLDCMCLLLTM